MDADREEETFARLRTAALPLFANLGYDGTDNQMIADTAGVPKSVLGAGGRKALYLAIVDSFYREQVAALHEVSTGFTPDEAGVERLLARMLDFYLDHVLELSLWQHRYLHDAADLIDIDRSFRQPMFQRIADVLGPEITDHIDVQMVFSIISWSLRGFISEGIVRPGAAPLGPDSAEGKRRFRSYIPYLAGLFFQRRT